MCSLGVTKTIVLGTSSFYGVGYRAILGRHRNTNGKKKMELLKVLKKRKYFQVQCKFYGPGSREDNLIASAAILIRDEVAGQISVNRDGDVDRFKSD